MFCYQFLNSIIPVKGRSEWIGATAVHCSGLWHDLADRIHRQVSVRKLRKFLANYKVDIFICCFFLQSNQMELILDGDNGVTDRLLKDFLASTSKRFLMNKYTINIPI